MFRQQYEQVATVVVATDCIAAGAQIDPSHSPGGISEQWENVYNKSEKRKSHVFLDFEKTLKV